MATKRNIETFSAGCPACDTTVSRIRALACPSREGAVLDMNEADGKRPVSVHRCPER